jgi:hypothetical protein
MYFRCWKNSFRRWNANEAYCDLFFTLVLQATACVDGATPARPRIDLK